MRSCCAPRTSGSAAISAGSRFIRGRLEIIPIPGKHADTLEEPAVQETGRLLAAVMDRLTPSLRPREFAADEGGLMEFGWTAEQEERYAATLAFARESLSDDLRQRDDAQAFSHELWQRCAAFGVLGWCMPEALGGSGLDIVTTVRLLEAIGHGCRDNGLTLGLNGQIWAVQEPLLSFGTDEQKARYLPRLCSGELLGRAWHVRAQCRLGRLQPRDQCPQGGRRLRPERPQILYRPLARGRALPRLRHHQSRRRPLGPLGVPGRERLSTATRRRRPGRRWA